MSGSFVLETLSAARDLGRLHEIASILARHGLGDLVRRVGIASLLERAGKLLHLEHSDYGSKSPEVHVREALEELGPTWVKVGQILSGRSDLLPPEWIEELSRLHEHATPVPIEQIREQLLEDLGAPPEEVFAAFDPEPLAAASIAQVHRAKLHNGTEVVLKIRRPGIKKDVAADMRLLARVAEHAEQEFEGLRQYRPTALVKQISRSLKLELNLRNEARSAERIAELLGGDHRIVIPHVHAEWTHERLCVMDYLEGPSVGEWLKERSLSDMDPKLAARIGADAVLEMVFVHGFFHADPHPGNVLVLSGERLGLLDFGMIGSLSDGRRLEFLELLAAFVQHDEETVVDLLIDWSEHGRTDARTLRADISAFIDQYDKVPLRELDTAALLSDITAILRENSLYLPDDIALLLKVFVTLDGMGRDLDPSFVTANHVEPFARRALAEFHSPRVLLRRGMSQLTRLMTHLPRTLRGALAQARRGKVGLEIDVVQLDTFGDRITRSANRVTIGLVTSALIVGTSISMTVSSGPSALGWPLFGLLGFASSVAAGTWLIISILRSR